MQPKFVSFLVCVVRGGLGKRPVSSCFLVLCVSLKVFLENGALKNN